MLSGTIITCSRIVGVLAVRAPTNLGYRPPMTDSNPSV